MKPFNENNPKMNTHINKNEYALHGDVIIFGADLPDSFSSFDVVNDDCLAYGEMTGHVHKIIGNQEDFELKENPDTKVKYLRVVNPVMLKHQEHSPIELNPGQYRIGIQREYDPFEKKIRSVAD